MRGYARPQEARALTQIMNHCRAETPEWFIQGIYFGLECCKTAYNPDNERQNWNDDYFIDDRHSNSLWGGIKEAWLYLYVFDITTIKPCLTEFEQTKMALDYYRNGIPGQVKSGCVSYTGGAIEFKREWLQTTATELVVFLKNKPLVLIGKTQDWRMLVDAEMQRVATIDPDHFNNAKVPVIIDQAEYDTLITTVTLPEHTQR